MPASSALTATALHAGYPRRADPRGGDRPDDPCGRGTRRILGPSGTGKTTLVRTLAGRITPTSGKVTFDGRSVARMRGKDKKRFTAAVRFVSQYAMTIDDPRETVESRLKLAAKEARKGGRTHSVTPQEMVATVGGLAEHFLPRRMMTLSGGGEQARAPSRPRPGPRRAADRGGPNMRGEITLALRATIDRLGIGGGADRLARRRAAAAHVPDRPLPRLGADPRLGLLRGGPRAHRARGDQGVRRVGAAGHPAVLLIDPGAPRPGAPGAPPPPRRGSSPPGHVQKTAHRLIDRMRDGTTTLIQSVPSLPIGEDGQAAPTIGSDKGDSTPPPPHTDPS